MLDFTVHVFSNDFKLKQELLKSLDAFSIDTVFVDSYPLLRPSAKNVILLDASFDDEKTIDLDFSFPVLKVMKSYPDFERIDFHDFIIYPFQYEELYCRIINLYNLYKNINHYDLINSQFKSYLSNLSHDVYSPIKLIQTQIRYLSSNTNIENYGEVFKSVLGQLDNVANILLSVPYSSIALDSLVIKKDLSLVNITNLVSDVVSQLDFYAEKQGVEVIYNSIAEKAEKPFICMNYTYFWRMVYNLLFNAIKYSLGGGVVRLSLLRNRSILKFVVADTGVGMTPEQLLRIRQYLMSQQEEDKNSRFGRGMVIIKLVANYLKATVNVDSKLGVGTTFTIEFKDVNWRLS